MSAMTGGTGAFLIMVILGGVSRMQITEVTGPPEVRRAHYLKTAADLRNLAATALSEQARKDFMRMCILYARMAKALAPQTSAD